jgi:hypothetical protein
MVLTSVNIHLTAEEKLDANAMCQVILDKVMAFEPVLRKSFLDMDVPVAVGEEIEQYKSSMRGKILNGLALIALIGTLMLAGLYISSTSNSEKGTDSSTVTAILSIIPELAKLLGAQPAQ